MSKLLFQESGGKGRKLLDRLGRPFQKLEGAGVLGGGAPANLEKPNRAEKRAMMRELRIKRRAAARERDKRASRTAKREQQPGRPRQYGVPTFPGPIGAWMRTRLHNLDL